MVHELMSERVRDVSDGLILGFAIDDTAVAGQSDLTTTRLYFFRVGAETRYLQRYTSLSNITSGSSTPSGGGFDFLGDSGVGSGSDIFRIEEDDWHLMHFGVGPTHPDLHVWHAISPKSNGNPAQARTGESEDIDTTSDDRGWYSSKQIDDKYDPPAFTERVAFRASSNTGEFLQWGFHNDGGSTLSGGDLDLIFTGRGYKAQPVTDQDLQDEMLRMALQRPDEPTIDTILNVIGGVNKWELGTLEPDAWSDVPEMTRTFSVEEFAFAGGGGQRQPAAARSR